MFIVNKVKSFLHSIADYMSDRLLKCEANSIVGFGGICVAGLVSFLAWVPVRYFFMGFVPDDAWGGWVAKLLITIVIGLPFGTFIPIIILIFTFIMWVDNR